MKVVRENQNTHFMFNNFFSENRSVYEIMSKIVLEVEEPQMTIWKRVACWISKATRVQAHARALVPTHPHPHPHTFFLISFTTQGGF